MVKRNWHFIWLTSSGIPKPTGTQNQVSIRKGVSIDNIGFGITLHDAGSYPFKECDEERTPVDEHCRKVVEMLKHARDAEVAGLEVLYELISRLI